MALGKQAKVLTKAQIDTLLLHVGNGRNPVRNRLIVLLSVKAGLRAKEIAHRAWVFEQLRYFEQFTKCLAQMTCLGPI
jgi:integrase